MILDGFAGRSGTSNLRIETHDCIGDLPNFGEYRFEFWQVFGMLWGIPSEFNNVRVDFRDAPVVSRTGGNCGERSGRQKAITIISHAPISEIA